MLQKLARKEIVRRAASRLGFTTNAAQSPLVKQEFEERARAAALAVYAEHEWGPLKDQKRVNVGIDQTVIDYPANAGPDDVISVSVWDGNRYIPLLERYIPASMQQDPLLDEGEPASVSDRARPLYFEKRQQILIAPRPDKIYEIKIIYNLNPDLATDEAVCVVDGELIILRFLADKRMDMGDEASSLKLEERYDLRAKAIGAKINSAHAVKRNSGYRARANARLSEIGYVPTSGTWPAVMPEN